MNKYLATLVTCAVLASSPALAAGLQVNLEFPLIHGGASLDISKGVTVGATLPIVGGGAKVGLLTPTDAVAVRLEAPLVHKAVAAGCCNTGLPYAKSAE